MSPSETDCASRQAFLCGCRPSACDAAQIHTFIHKSVGLTQTKGKSLHFKALHKGFFSFTLDLFLKKKKCIRMQLANLLMLICIKAN